jgi:hypothetical protein
MYVADEILVAVSPPFPETRDGKRMWEFRQTVDAFLEGGEFSVAENPDCKPSDAMLARVHPIKADFWDIRSIVPKPGVRAFGAFSAKNTFVALTWDYRENLDDEGAFSAEVERCINAWRDLFGTETPFKGESLDDYLTNFYPV